VGRVSAVRAKQPERLPTVMTRDEIVRVLDALSGVQQLMAKLLYGSGLRLMECVRLRVKDADFAQHQVLVRDGKGGKDRVTPLWERRRPLPRLSLHTRSDRRVAAAGGLPSSYRG